jgi:tetratricopeptide (TPR) repeat protein
MARSKRRRAGSSQGEPAGSADSLFSPDQDEEPLVGDAAGTTEAGDDLAVAGSPPAGVSVVAAEPPVAARGDDGLSDGLGDGLSDGLGDGLIGPVKRIPRATPPEPLAAAESTEPEPESVAAADSPDLAPLLRDLRRELSDSHAAHARSSNAITSLASSLKEVLGRIRRHDRGLNLNSFVAYVIFTTLLGGGFFMLYRTRADRLVAERDAALRGQKTAVDEATRSRLDLEARDAAEKKALDYWGLLAGGKREEAIARAGEIMHERLSPVEQQVFQAGVQRARREIIDAAFADGVEAYGQAQWKRAAAAFKRALTYEADGPRAAQMRYYEGVSLHKLGDYAEAAKQLDLALAGGAERTVGPDARFYLATALEMLRQWERARDEYEKFWQNHVAHPMAQRARRRAYELRQKLAQGQAPQAPAPPGTVPAAR